MNMKNNRTCLSLLLSCFMMNAVASNSSLCQAEETILFSCMTKQNKIISLCASKELSATNGYIQYRFGNKKAVELTYPANQTVPASKAFQGRSQMFSGGGGIYLRFKNKAYDYLIYEGIGKGWTVSGLVLLKNSKFLTYFACTNKAIVEITPDLLSQINIPQDSDETEFFPADIPGLS